MIISGYKNEGFSKPTDDINPKRKRSDKSWFLQYCKFIWGYAEKNGDTPYSQRDFFTTLRAYAAGKQSTDQYEEKFKINVDNEPSVTATEYDSGMSKKGKRSGLTNINYRIVSVFPKFMRILLGKFSIMDHVIGATALDKISGDEREQKKYDLYATKILKSLNEDVYKIRGLKYESPGYLPDNVEELELFASMGGFKLLQEEAMELLIQHSFDISNWDKELKDKIIFDFVTLNMSAIRDDFNTNTNKSELRWMDVARLIVPRSSINDHSKMPWWGYIEYYTIAELRQKGFTEEELESFVSSSSGKYGNSDYNSLTYNEASGDVMGKPYDDFNIRVLVCEIRSTDTFYDVEHTNKFGKVKIYEEQSYGKIRDTDTKKTRITRVNNVYNCKWVIGTEHVFEYGIKNGQPRVGKDVQLSCHVFKIEGQSMVESCITHLDELQLDFLLLQNAKANARSSGIAINIDSLSNIKMGGKKMHPLDIMKIYRSTGDLLFKVTPMGLSGFGNNLGKPMEELRGGIGQIAVDLMNDISFRLKMIQEVTGINEIAAAGNPDPNQSVGGSELALMATDNAIRPLYKGYIAIKEKSAKSICLRTQLLLKINKKAYEAYYPVLGKPHLKVLTIGQKAMEATYNIRIEAIPTEQEKRDLKAYIISAMQPGKSGVALLKPSHGLLLNEMLSANIPVKRIRVLLGFLENKEREIQLLKEKENYQVQAKLKQESDANAINLEMKALKFKTDEQLRLEKGKALIKVGIEMTKEQEMDKAIKTLDHYFKLAEDANRIKLESEYSNSERVVV